MTTINFKDAYGGTYTLKLEIYKYWNNQIAIQLTDVEDNAPYMVATCCIEDELKEDEVCIKNYSENEGILECLIENKIISQPIRQVNSGYVTLNICKLLKTR